MQSFSARVSEGIGGGFAATGRGRPRTALRHAAYAYAALDRCVDEAEAFPGRISWSTRALDPIEGQMPDDELSPGVPGRGAQARLNPVQARLGLRRSLAFSPPAALDGLRAFALAVVRPQAELAGTAGDAGTSILPLSAWFGKRPGTHASVGSR